MDHRMRGRVSAAASFEHGVRRDLRARRWVRLHVLLIGLATFGVLWALSHALLRAGVESMALRHGIAIALAYLVYLALLWAWAKWLLSREQADGPDLGGLDLTPGSSNPGGAGPCSGAGGDFGGAGASGDFGEAAGKAVSATVEAAGCADEGAVVLVPLALAVGVAVLLATVLGFAVFGLFGIEILMGVAVEIAFASAGGALALKAQREGWLMHALRRTALPMSVLTVLVVGAGLALARWLPQAATLPQALRMIFG